MRTAQIFHETRRMVHAKVHHKKITSLSRENENASRLERDLISNLCSVSTQISSPSSAAVDSLKYSWKLSLRQFPCSFGKLFFSFITFECLVGVGESEREGASVFPPIFFGECAKTRRTKCWWRQRGSCDFNYSTYFFLLLVSFYPSDGSFGWNASNFFFCSSFWRHKLMLALVKNRECLQNSRKDWDEKVLGKISYLVNYLFLHPFFCFCMAR